MLFKITDIINESKKQVEEITGKEFRTLVNKDKRKINPQHFYFLYNDELNIEIAVSIGDRNGMRDKDVLDCRIQKPVSLRKTFDFRSIHAGDECVEYIINEVRNLIK